MGTLHQLTNDLLDRAQAGDPEARRQLLERPRIRLKQAISLQLDSRLAPRLDASDLVQETLLEAERRLDGYLRDRPIPYLSWLRQIARDRIIDAHRRHITAQRRTVTREGGGPMESAVPAVAPELLPANHSSPSGQAIHRERLVHLSKALERLRPGERELIVARHLENQPLAVIAARLGLTEGAVKLRIFRSLIRLRTLLEKMP